eukprot:8113516-Pyramimonas_sp.AAC.1
MGSRRSAAHIRLTHLQHAQERSGVDFKMWLSPERRARSSYNSAATSRMEGRYFSNWVPAKAPHTFIIHPAKCLRNHGLRNS